ncbi:MAG: HD domain-containing protein [Candidatus Thorarchaeota archaeon]|jgi:3'-5' exoribonuclease
MYLDENLTRINKVFNPSGFEFKKDGDIIRLVEGRKYLLNNSPEMKEYFKNAFKLTFNEIYLWHINYEGISILNTRKYKTEPSKDVDELKQEFYQSIGHIEEDALKTSMESYFIANDSFFEAPAALYWHHGYRAGLLEHTVQVLKLARLIVENLDDDILVDKDLIIAGIILHDIGKINCYQFKNGAIIPTQILIEQKHIVNGIKSVSQNIESEKLDTIIHIIASHHNLPEWGSPVEPKCNEAWIVHCIENLSSKVMG